MRKSQISTDGFSLPLFLLHFCLLSSGNISPLSLEYFPPLTACYSELLLTLLEDGSWQVMKVTLSHAPDHTLAWG